LVKIRATFDLVQECGLAGWLLECDSKMRSYAENVKRKYRKWIVEIQNFISIE
jgi:hypothetical protein